jgi:hypothetical protein
LKCKVDFPAHQEAGDLGRDENGFRFGLFVAIVAAAHVDVAAPRSNGMAFLLPHFEYDAFVSYSHGVRQGDKAPLRDWTLNLIRDLELSIRSIDTEFDNLHIWRDKQIDPTIFLTDELRAKVQGSGILMIVMSPRYLASAWCKDELEWFKGQVQDRTRDHGRIFVIRAVATDEKAWPEFLRDSRGHALLGFQFHTDSQFHADSVPFNWMDTKEHNEPYVRELLRLQTALIKRLRELSANAQRRIKVQPPASTAPANGPRRIYLHARPEHASISQEVKLALKEDGIDALSILADPGRDLADFARESRARIEAAKRCDAMALLRADDHEAFIGDLLEIGVDERQRIQSSRDAPLPCAVLDRSGQVLPIDVTSSGIERFDLEQKDWRGQFRGWLNRAHEPPVVPL